MQPSVRLLGCSRLAEGFQIGLLLPDLHQLGVGLIVNLFQQIRADIAGLLPGQCQVFRLDQVTKRGHLAQGHSNGGQAHVHRELLTRIESS